MEKVREKRKTFEENRKKKTEKSKASKLKQFEKLRKELGID